MHYLVVIHKDPQSDYGVTVPDLPGCFSAGETLDQALEYVQEAIECHLEGMLLDGENIIVAQPLEKHKNNPDYKEGIWAIVTVDISKLSGKAKRVNITLPERLLANIDNYAATHGETRSGFLVQAAIEYIGNHSEQLS